MKANMTRKTMANVATALVCLSAVGVLVVGLRRAAASGSVRETISRAAWNRMLPSEPASAAIAVRRGARQRELVAVLIVTTTCGGTRNPDFVPAVLAMKTELARRAAAEGKTLRLVGVALDDRVGDGLALLNRVGPFHELSVGGNWLNSNAVQYIWRSGDRSTAIPQWVLLERDVVAGPDAIAVTPDRVVAIVAGADRMRAWIRSSRAQLPPRTPAPGTRVGE